MITFLEIYLSEADTLIYNKYIYIVFYLLHEEPCNVDVANKPLLLLLFIVKVETLTLQNVRKSTVYMFLKK